VIGKKGSYIEREEALEHVAGYALHTDYSEREIISTGTPAGVGLGMTPPQYLKAGDVVELGIDQLGESRQSVVAWQPGNRPDDKLPFAEISLWLWFCFRMSE
jgi:2-keto-4-pentenoate hydratase/2-oxohepta-3-ene-1,7-dioic acid hydratase in catechol pathway